ncbi:MAG TPA: hypothetical protein VFH43_14650, partial [Candidatus Kapabacteria bacterium]|nr:hypothetical protein [Candidatus Kapabacteria bacterium]
MKQKVVVRETEDTIVIKETRVIHQPQPVITDTLTYTNTATGEENVVVNNYFAPAPSTFGTYDPWTNSYPTWYDDYWYRPRAAFVISIGDPYHHHHSRWFNHHWRRHSYYQSHWDYDYYSPWNNWYHTSYRGPGWAYYDPYYPYPPMYGYGYGCYSPVYDPFYYGYGYGYGGYYGGHYGGHYGHGHHDYYGDNDDYDNDGKDRNGRERRRGNVGGEERGRGGVTTDGGTPNTGVTMPRDGSSPVNLPQADRVRAVPVSGGASRNPANTGSATATNGGSFNSDAGQSTGRGVGSVDISTGSIPLDANSDTRFGNTSNVREVKSSPSQGAPGVYQGSSTRNVTNAGTEVSQPAERRPAPQPATTRTASAPANVVKNTDATSGTRSTTNTTATPRSTTKNSTDVSSAPVKSDAVKTAPSKSTPAPSYTPRSSSSSNSGASGVSNSGSGRSSVSSSSSSSGSSSSRGSD